jgi:hypothetical protein
MDRSRPPTHILSRSASSNGPEPGLPDYNMFLYADGPALVMADEAPPA